MSRGKRDRVVSFRVTEEEETELDRMATDDGMERADYCRAVLFRPRVIDRLYLLVRGGFKATLKPADFKQLIAEVEED